MLTDNEKDLFKSLLSQLATKENVYPVCRIPNLPENVELIESLGEESNRLNKLNRTDTWVYCKTTSLLSYFSERL